MFDYNLHDNEKIKDDELDNKDFQQQNNKILMSNKSWNLTFSGNKIIV